jgi:hypothetical protein
VPGSLQLSVLEESWKLDKLPSLGGAEINVECIGLECMVSMFH